MARRDDNKDYLHLVWKSSNNHTNYTIGQLAKNGGYQFSYNADMVDALANGFEPLVAFPELNKTYESPEMFPAFSSRLPDKKRRDIQQILNKYGLTEYDEYQLLKKSGARLPIDSLSFIDPIFSSTDKVERTFFIAGTRHYIGCNGEDCNSAFAEISTGDFLTLKSELGNKDDANAVQICNQANELLGYIPRYYSKIITEKLNRGSNYTCAITEYDTSKNCDDCIKVDLCFED